MRNTLIPILVAICLFITGVAILNIQLWYSAKAEYLAGARYAANNINHILEEASQATQTAVNIAGKECDLEEQYQLGTEAALKPHLRTIIILKQGIVWCTSLPGNRVLLSRIPVFPDSNLLLAPAIDTVNRLPILLYQSQFADTRILVTISDQHIRGALNVPLKGVRYVLRVADDIIGPTGDVMTLNGHYPYTEKVHSTKYHFTIIFNSPPLFSFYRLIDKGFGILIFILLIACAAAFLLDRYFNKSATPEEILRRAIINGEIVPFYQPVVNGLEGTLRGVEVLARWKQPHGGYISPAAISPTFVDECLNYRDSFTRRDLNLVLEVTEREPLNVDESLVQRLNILHENGFVIALDDFGTGYSGLSYLHDLHIDYIKIDHSFVGRVNADPESTRILDCVLDLARKLSISIVAEGVETKEQLDYLNQNNITFQQGYYFYKPVTYIDLVKIILSKPKVKVVVE
ncbi:TPA: EAL domain-containing protein [Escherichia coli]|nr:EAL domain-containing protein [Escherichia coli]